MLHPSGFHHVSPSARIHQFRTYTRAVRYPQRQVVGKTLVNPKRDSKWDRGRTRHVLHFGAHVRGGTAVGSEVRGGGVPSIYCRSCCGYYYYDSANLKVCYRYHCVCFGPTGLARTP